MGNPPRCPLSREHQTGKYWSSLIPLHAACGRWVWCVTGVLRQPSTSLDTTDDNKVPSYTHLQIVHATIVQVWSNFVNVSLGEFTSTIHSYQRALGAPGLEICNTFLSRAVFNNCICNFYCSVSQLSTYIVTIMPHSNCLSYFTVLKPRNIRELTRIFRFFRSRETLYEATRMKREQIASTILYSNSSQATHSLLKDIYDIYSMYYTRFIDKDKSSRNFNPNVGVLMCQQWHSWFDTTAMVSRGASIKSHSSTSPHPLLQLIISSLLIMYNPVSQEGVGLQKNIYTRPM